MQTFLFAATTSEALNQYGNMLKYNATGKGENYFRQTIEKILEMLHLDPWSTRSTRSLLQKLTNLSKNYFFLW